MVDIEELNVNFYSEFIKGLDSTSPEYVEFVREASKTLGIRCKRLALGQPQRQS